MSFPDEEMPSREEVPGEVDYNREQIEKMFRLAAVFGWRPRSYDRADLTRFLLKVFELQERRDYLGWLYQEREQDLRDLAKAIERSLPDVPDDGGYAAGKSVLMYFSGDGKDVLKSWLPYLMSGHFPLELEARPEI